MIMAWPSDEDL